MMRAARQQHWRSLVRLLRVVLRARLDLLIPITFVPQPVVRGCLRMLRALLPTPGRTDAERLRQALLDLGPVYIKLGQLLSTRRDLLATDLADALATLQDRVPAIEAFDVQSFVSTELGHPAANHFTEIDPQPLASASIAQVHAAVLHDGSEVVLKVVRPAVRAQIAADMAGLRYLADRISHWIPASRRLHLDQITRDHEQVLLNELSMFNEAHNQVQLRRNFADSDLLYVPRVYTQYTRESLLVMERIYGIPISQIETLKARQVDLQRLAHKGVETFFTQVFEHNFFHADMHPGNIYIDCKDPQNPRYIALDCAIIGSLTAADQRYLAQNLLAFFRRDYRQVVELHLQSGWVPANTDPVAFEAVIRDVCEPIFAKPLSEISFGEFVVKLLATAGQFDMEVQPQLVLLQKTLLYIEGLGRQLYPQLDLWATAQPFMERWAIRHLGPMATVDQWLRAGPTFWEQIVRLPEVLAQHQHALHDARAQLAKQQQAIQRLLMDPTGGRQMGWLRRATGFSLALLGLWTLWPTLSVHTQTGDWTTLAGLVATILGVSLWQRR